MRLLGGKSHDRGESSPSSMTPKPSFDPNTKRRVQEHRRWAHGVSALPLRGCAHGA
jgi:hypothetical protein